MTSQQIMKHYLRITSFWAGVSGANIEIVLHDFSKGDHSIVAIYNNELSGRKKGDGMTDWEQAKVREILNSGNQCDMNFRGVGVKGQTIRCSVLLIQDEDKLLGALCASVDVSHFIEMADYYRVLAFLPEDEPEKTVVEPAAPTVVEMVNQMLTEMYGVVPDVPAELTSFEKMKVVERLKERGAFQIKGTVSEVAFALDISESTVYRYLKKLSR